MIETWFGSVMQGSRCIFCPRGSTICQFHGPRGRTVVGDAVTGEEWHTLCNQATGEIDNGQWWSGVQIPVGALPRPSIVVDASAFFAPRG